ncbi:MAG TPA: type I methionyl aminopeptidase [Aminobacterium sp.]|jgi:methionyl aminopeptidase|uniref:type I methionyl aminopeptidase n=1 Tax=Aminobacterium TaxID=81466 RepID=UPI000466060D|nr:MULTISPECIES: type I methionyl aminopeptidase [Aminobacterium]HCA40521.1 type I methionyl aminopeptidase [Aminobacterium sp.]
MIVLKTEEDLRYMRKAGRIVADVLDLIAGIVRPGITTADIDRAAEELMTKESATPAFKGYRVPGIPVAFPGAVCASINEEIVHGIPTQERYLEEGDIISIDVGACYKGYYGDAACTFPVGQVSLERQTLINVTLESLNRAVSVAKDGNTIGDIGYAVESYVVPKGFGLVRDYTGHGVGKHLHEPPQVPNFGRPGRGVTLKAGMTIAIEPMVMSGAEDTVVGPDRWVVLTADGSDAAHFERSVLITKDGAEVLTPWEWA